MFWDILRKDLKRKKTINIVILLFIILAAMFVASGLNNVLTVVNGTDYYLNQADIGDYVVLTQQGDGGVPELLDTCQYVKDYRMDHIMYATKGNIKAEGKELDMANKAMIKNPFPKVRYIFSQRIIRSLQKCLRVRFMSQEIS